MDRSQFPARARRYGGVTQQLDLDHVQGGRTDRVQERSGSVPPSQSPGPLGILVVGR